MSERWLLFAGLCAAVSVSPGPAILYIITRTLEQGIAAGLASIGGIATGGLVHVIASAFGVAAAAAAWPLSLTLLQLFGATYLGYLGITRIRSAGRSAGVEETGALKGLAHIYRDGLIVNLTNPKTALFLLAFLPQFVMPGSGPLERQLLLLGATFVAIASLTDLGYVLAAGLLRSRLVAGAAARRWPGWVAGGLYLALGALGVVDALRQIAAA